MTRYVNFAAAERIPGPAAAPRRGAIHRLKILLGSDDYFNEEDSDSFLGDAFCNTLIRR